MAAMAFVTGLHEIASSVATLDFEVNCSPCGESRQICVCPDVQHRAAGVRLIRAAGASPGRLCFLVGNRCERECALSAHFFFGVNDNSAKYSILNLGYHACTASTCGRKK